MKKTLSVFFLSAMLFLIAIPLHAQTGCVDSPENPTNMLGLVASAAALAVKVWRSHRRKG